MDMKLGIIGFGGMAYWHYSNAPKAGVKVIAVHDIDPARLVMARELGLKAYENLDDLLKDEDINFVLVATPNNIHKELAIAALRAGKHVMVEKPATLSVSDWDEMVDASKKAGKILTVHQNRRWDSDYRMMCQVVESGELGKIYSVESRVFGSGGALFGWRAFKEFGGGMLLDWGVHLVDQFLNMFPKNRVISVYARLMSIHGEEVDNYDKLMLTMDDGTVLHAEICSYAYRGLPRWFVVGDEGTLKIDSFLQCEGDGYTKPRHSAVPVPPIVVMTAAGPTRMMAPRPPESKEDYPLPDVQSDWTELYMNLVDVMNGKAELIVTPASVRRVLQALEALYQSAEEGRAIKVNI